MLTALARGTVVHADSLWADSPGHLSLANASPGNLSAPVQAEHQTGSQAPACASKSSLPEQTGHGSSGGHVPLYPPSVDPSASTECLQPWQQQLETWHERQQWQAGDLRLDVGASSANGGLGLPYLASTPASLSTTMTSCVDIDDPSSCAQAQQQQAVVSGLHLRVCKHPSGARVVLFAKNATHVEISHSCRCGNAACQTAVHHRLWLSVSGDFRHGMVIFGAEA